MLLMIRRSESLVHEPRSLVRSYYVSVVVFSGVCQGHPDPSGGAFLCLRTSSIAGCYEKSGSFQMNHKS